jgi:peptidoglycan pentaglycine glycine transferase (the first glycine)
VVEIVVLSHTVGLRSEISRESVDPEWDAFVDAAPGGHHLQTTAWGQVKAAYGWRAVRVKLRTGSELAGGCQLLLRPVPLGTIAYCPRGPLSAESDPAVIDAVLDAVAAIARRERIVYAKVQPPAGGEDLERVLLARGFVASDLPAAPVATVLVDLERPEDERLRRMRPSARANMRKASSQGVVVRAAGDGGLETYAGLLAKTSERQSFPPYPIEYYAEILSRFGTDGRAELLLAEREGEVLAGSLIVGFGESVVCKMSVWSGSHPKLHPNELLHWHAMAWARERGYRWYDLEGIKEPVARALLAGEPLPELGRHGPTAFKLGLGGEVTVFPRAYDRSFHRLLVWPARLVAPRLSRLESIAHRFVGRV